MTVVHLATKMRLNRQQTFNSKLKDYGNACRMRGASNFNHRAIELEEQALAQLKAALHDLVQAAREEGAAIGSQ